MIAVEKLCSETVVANGNELHALSLPQYCVQAVSIFFFQHMPLESRAFICHNEFLKRRVPIADNGQHFFHDNGSNCTGRLIGVPSIKYAEFQGKVDQFLHDEIGTN